MAVTNAHPHIGRAIDVPTALLMLKAPIAGEVKTRLGRQIGAEAALAAYRSLVIHQLQVIPHGWNVHIAYAPCNAMPLMKAWLGNHYQYSAQCEGDLGARLSVTVERHFAQQGGSLIIMGGDCPYLDCIRLQEAALALEKASVVVVPAVDGGYCLLGLRRSQPHIFRDISWSTAEVLSQTKERLRELEVDWSELAPAEDVDDEDSWRRAKKAYPGLSKHQ